MKLMIKGTIIISMILFNSSLIADTSKVTSEDDDIKVAMKESAIDMLIGASKKYKANQITKDQFIEVALQVGQTAEYAKKDKDKGTESRPLESKIQKSTTNIIIGSPNIDSYSDEQLKKFENVDIPQLRKEFKNLRDIQKKALIKEVDLKCAQDTDCVFLAIGQRMCGGSEGFLLVSKLDSNFSSIQGNLLKLEDADREFQTKIRGFSGLCSIVTHGVAKCNENVCTQIGLSGSWE